MSRGCREQSQQSRRVGKLIREQGEMFMLSRGIVKLRFVGLSDVLRRFNHTTLFEVGVGVIRKNLYSMRYCITASESIFHQLLAATRRRRKITKPLTLSACAHFSQPSNFERVHPLQSAHALTSMN
jgi:hypothetical protein